MLHRLWPFIAVILFATVFMIGPAKAQGVSQTDMMATQDVIRDQLSAFQTQEHDRAFSHAAPNIRSIFGTTDRFIGMVRNGYPAIYRSESFSFGRNRLENDFVFQELIITDPQGKQWQAVYTLQMQEDGIWKITGVQVNPSVGAAT